MVGALASPRTQEKMGHKLGKRERVRTQKMPSSKRRWNAEKENSKAHVSFTSQELNKYQSMQQNQANTEAMANA